VAVDKITQQKPDNVNPPKSKEKILQAKIAKAVSLQIIQFSLYK